MKKDFNFVDFVASGLPGLASLVPAIMTVKNAHQVLGFEVWQAWVIGVVAEGLGFATVTTTLDVFEQDQVGVTDGKPRLTWRFWVSAGGTLVYLLVMLLVNSFLDPGSMLRKVALGLLAILAVVGGLMVAVRNQLKKHRAALAVVEGEAKAERERQIALQLQRDQDEIAHNRRLQDEEIAHARFLKDEELKRQHELKVLKLKSKVSESTVRVAGKSQQPSNNHPDTYGKWRRWTEVPDAQKLQVAEKIGELLKANSKTYKGETAKWVKAVFGVEERVAYMWIGYAERDYPQQTGGVV